MPASVMRASLALGSAGRQQRRLKGNLGQRNLGEALADEAQRARRGERDVDDPTSGGQPVVDGDHHGPAGLLHGHQNLGPERQPGMRRRQRHLVKEMYEHCVRAIQHGLRFGEHGLPLMGSGDWNDGMNLVGIHGKGESVWLAFFMIEVLSSFAHLATTRHDDVFAESCRMEVAKLRQNIEAHAWDGEWYRRAYFDDGSPLGSKINPECMIDSISQSWSVLSGMSDPEHSRIAMNSLDKYLVRRNSGLIQLLDPPFDKADMNPGYIKGYVPGVRENGGQYTHAAIWATMAFAKMGDSEKAWELLNLINPVNHALDADGVATYKTEPYVMAADVYGQAPHTGRGVWTWYTGSASWMYRLMLESLLGLKREGNTLSFSPCIPKDWTSYSMSYRFGNSSYKIAFIQTLHTEYGKAVATTISLDGVVQSDHAIKLLDDYREHKIEVSISRLRSSAESDLT